MPEPKEPVESPAVRALRRFANALPEVEEGASCVNRAFRVRGKSFAYLGSKPETYRLMIKLTEALPAARAAETKRPGAFAVGKHGWTTVNLPHSEKVTKGLLEGWIEESYRSFASSPPAARTVKTRSRR